MSDRLEIPKVRDPQLIVRQRELELGIVGKFFGSDPTPAIIGLIAIVAVLALASLAILRPMNEAIEIGSKLFVPIVTGYLGYLAGRRQPQG